MMTPACVDVRFRTLGATGDRPPESDLSILSVAERRRAERFVQESDRRAYIAAHALLRRSLSRRAGFAPGDWRFVEVRHGKPFIAPDHALERRLSFSLSHTRGCVACAVGFDVDVGVDVECLTTVADELQIARSYFDTSELEALERCEPTERRRRFVKLWTLKEAYLKALGVGLSGSLRDVRFTVDDLDNVACHAGLDGWNFELHPVGAAHMLAVAVRAAAGVVTRIDVARDDV